MRRAGLHADVRALFTTPTLKALAAALNAESGVVDVPPNGIPQGCRTIDPQMLPLVELTDEELARIVESVPGGAANIADIYPLAPLQEGILFHHLLEPEADPYLLSDTYRFDSRERLDAFLAALQAVIDRHDILRTGMFWEGLREPVQVVHREARLVVEEWTVEPGDRRLDVRRAPLLHAGIARENDGRWVMTLLMHHLISDHTALELMLQEIDAHLTGRQDLLPEPLPFRNFVAQARLGVSRSEHERFFSDMLGGVDEPTAPFGIAAVHGDGSEIVEAHRAIDDGLARRLRAQARALGVSAASLCHVAWGRVVAALSGRDDVVFGTVLFGRMQGGEGADRVMGLFINTLPLRVSIDSTSVGRSVRDTHVLLAKLLRHEHASLALAQRCSGVAPPVPLFSSLLNYRYLSGEAREDVAGVWEGIDRLASRERTN